jgi:WD40 repeat protein
VVSVSGDGTAYVWAVDEVDILSVLRDRPGSVSTLAASADGRRVAVGGPDGSLQIRDPMGESPPVTLGTQEPTGYVTSMAGQRPAAVFSPDGRYVAAKDPVRLWNIADLTKPVEIPVSYPNALAFGPDGKRMVVLTRDAGPSIRNVDGTGAATPLPADGLGPAPDLRDVAWSSDGHHITAITGDGAAVLWDLRNRTGPTTLPGGKGNFGPLIFSADGTRLASAGADGSVHIWNVDNVDTVGSPVTLRGHQGGTWSVAFQPDGRHLVTTGNDATIRIWKIEDHAEPLELTGFRATTNTVAPLSDDRYISTHDDGTIRTWRCPPCTPIDELLTHVDDYVSRELTQEEREIYLPAG